MKMSQGTLIGVQIKELSFRTQIFSRTSAAVMPVKNKCPVTKFTHVKNCLSFLVTAKCGSPGRQSEQIIDDNFNKVCFKENHTLKCTDCVEGIQLGLQIENHASKHKSHMK